MASGKTIQITVRDRIARTDKTAYVCGNSDYVIKFDFDDEWQEYQVKTARFDTLDGTYMDVVFDGYQCTVPVLSGIYGFKVGVYAGNLRTTTPAYISAKKSILCGSGVPAAPSDDVYHQIMTKLNGISSDIGTAVREYLKENPVAGGAEIEITETADGVEIAITDEEGTKSYSIHHGKDGDPGYTPVKGKDYWTTADKAEMVSAVLAALPVYTGEVETV